MSRRSRSSVVALMVSSVVAALLTAAPATRADVPHYYLALGDSLSVGYQPAHDGLPAGDTDQGYVDDIYAKLKQSDPSLVLEKLGCSGETTDTMINGGKCDYPAGSQLKAAVAFLSTHPGQVSYLTIDIGANDVDNCAPNGSIDTACLLQGEGTIAKNLNTILSALHTADGGTPRSVAMNYYDPFLQYWLTGTQGKVVATASVALALLINTTEQLLYTAYGFKIADVFSAFQSANFTGALTGTPVNVQTLCKLTYMCTVQNIHANPAGYQVIADTFAPQLG